MPISDQEALEAAAQARLVAVVGMTDGSKPGRASYEIPRMLQERGVELIPVNPKIDQALGRPALKSLSELKARPDIVDVFRRSEAIPELADELLALPAGIRPGVVWLQSGITHPQAEAALEKAGYRVVSDRCLGVYAARARARD